MTDRNDPDRNSDADVRRLLELAGPRAAPPEQVAARVHDALLQEWSEMPARAKSSNDLPRRLFAIAATVVATVVIGYGVMRNMPGPAYAGEVVFASGGYSIRGSDDAPSPYLMPGSMVRTSNEGRVLVKLDDSTSLRLDINTSATMHENLEIWLHTGRIYVDAAGGQRKSAIRIITPMASITDIGTQFEVSVDGDKSTVSVREGKVNVAVGSDRISAQAQQGSGEVIHLDGMRLVKRSSVATTDEKWSWIHASSPEYDLSSGSLADFLTWACREAGLELRWEDNITRQQAEADHNPRGPIDKMDLTQAIDEVLASSKRFRRIDAEPHELLVGSRR